MQNDDGNLEIAALWTDGSKDRAKKKGEGDKKMQRASKLYALALSLITVALVVWIPRSHVKADGEDHNPTFTTIEPPDGDGTITFLFDINDRGEIVGAYNSTPSGHRYGFLRSNDGEFTRINFPESFRTHADGINPGGDIVGWYARVPGEFHGYLRKKNGEFIQIDFPGAKATKAIGIDPRGDIVGIYCLDISRQCAKGNKNDHGFLLSEGEFTTIDFPGALETEAYKINPRGQILGSYVDPEGRSHLFLLSEREFTTSNIPGAFETVSLPPIPPQLWFTTIDFPGAVETAIDGANAGLNARGDIVGDYCAVPPLPCKPQNVHGLLLSEGEFTTIDVPGALGTSAYGINARGDIVGFFNVDANHIIGFLRSR